MSTFVFISVGSIAYTEIEVFSMGAQQLDPVLVGSVIARFRLERGITQEVLSGLSDIGRTHLSAIERGERKPTLETLYRISNALDIPMSTIVIAMEQEITARQT